MNTQRRSLGWLSGLLWGLATLFGLVIAGLAWFVTASAVGENPDIAPRNTELLILLVMALSLGLVIALAQWYALRFRVRPAAWIGLTMLGFWVAEWIVANARLGWLEPYATRTALLGQAVIFGGVLGAAQWFALIGRIEQPARWIAVSLVGWSVAGLLGVTLSSLDAMNGPLLWLLGLLFGGAILPPLWMVWLLNRPALRAA